MKTTKMIAKIAGVVLAGMMALSFASCESKEEKLAAAYLADLETRVAAVESAVQAKDGTAYDTALAQIAALKDEEKYKELPSEAAFPESKKAALASLTARIGTANANAPANAESDFDFKTTKDFSGVIITRYKGSRKDVVIPATIQGVPVVRLDDGCFGRQDDITSVVIPDSVTIIGRSAFNGCKKLTKVTLPKSLEAIQSYAFKECESLESIDFPASLKLIDREAFYKSGLKEARLNEGLLCLGWWSFSRCEKLAAIYFPKSLRWITVSNQRNGIAIKCPALETISIPEGVRPKWPTGSDWTKNNAAVSDLFSGTKISESIALQKTLADYGSLEYFYVTPTQTGAEGKAFLELWRKYGSDDVAY